MNTEKQHRPTKKDYPGFKFRVEKLYAVRKKISTAGIYFLHDDDEIVYIGISTVDMFARIFQHQKDKVFNAVTCHFYQEDNIEIVEANLINEVQPKYNAIYTKNPEKELLGGRSEFAFETVKRLNVKIRESTNTRLRLHKIDRSHVERKPVSLSEIIDQAINYYLDNL